MVDRYAKFATENLLSAASREGDVACQNWHVFARAENEKGPALTRKALS